MSRFVEPIRDPEKLKALQNLPEVLADPRYHLIATFGFKVALRISDLLRLKVSSVRGADGRIREQLSVVEAKTKKKRNIPLSASTQEMLQTYFDAVKPKQGDWLFPSARGTGAMSRQHVCLKLKEWAEAAGIDGNIGTHSFRKSFAYQAVAHRGVRIERVQRALNHSSPQITQVYADLTDEDAMEAYDAQED